MRENDTNLPLKSIFPPYHEHNHAGEEGWSLSWPACRTGIKAGSTNELCPLSSSFAQFECSTSET